MHIYVYVTRLEFIHTYKAHAFISLPIDRVIDRVCIMILCISINTHYKVFQKNKYFE